MMINAQSMQANMYIWSKQSINQSHSAHSITKQLGSYKGLGIEANWNRVNGALNLDIESQGEADERIWGVCLITLIPGQGEHWISEGVGVQKVGTLSTDYWLDWSWAFTQYASTHVVWATWVTHRIVGDRLHISFVYQLPYQKDFTCLGTKLNNHKHCLLRRTSDSCLAK